MRRAPKPDERGRSAPRPSGFSNRRWLSVTIDNMASAIDWLDHYIAKSVELLDLYADDAIIACGCGDGKVLSGRPSFRPYWIDRFERKPAVELIELEDWQAGVVAVSYRTEIDVVRSVLTFDDRTGLIVRQRCGPL